MDEPMFSISVVIPAYNAKRYIQKAIASALDQSYAPTEIIVVDDGSTDETGAVVRSFAPCVPPVRYIRQTNQGPSAARNKGIEASEGELVAFLDADDRWFKDKLSMQAEIFSKYPDLDWVAGAYVKVMDEKIVCESTRARPFFGSAHRIDAMQALVHRGLLSTDTVIVRKTALEEAGVFDVNLASGEDLDLWARMAVRHPVVGYVWEPVAEYSNANPCSLTKSLDPGRAQSLRLLATKLIALSSGQGEMTRLLLNDFVMNTVLTEARAYLLLGKRTEGASLLHFFRQQLQGTIPIKMRVLNSMPFFALACLKFTWSIYTWGRRKAMVTDR